MKNKIKISIALLLFIVSNFNCNAQLYPVQLTPVFNSPYSIKISEYATSMDTKMRLMVNPTDISINNRKVRLKLYIQGNGLNIQTSDYVQNQKPIFINGGELLTLSNTDISALFRLENLQGINASQYATGLPEGMYNFCFEMYDYITNQKISQKSCVSLYLILNDPPFLNTPQKNEQIASSDFPNIMFTWTPRQMNATNVSYKFELKQLLDPSLDPQFAFQMSPLLHEETLFGTALIYNLSMPALIPGMRYAWRVRAVSTTGLSENAIFKNDGYSEIYWFKYTQKCNAPTFALSEIVSPSSAKITWQGTPDHTKYQVQYRKKAILETNKRGKTKEKTFEWFSSYSLNNQVLLTNLEPETEYEFRVGSTCTTEAEGVQSFSYSNINTFAIPKKENAIASYNCGIKPNLNITNKTPIDNLIASETFTAGDFPVTVLSLEKKKSPYSGRGYIIVPYLADTKLAVEFKDILINTDYQLISGVVETSYNPNWGNVSGNIFSDPRKAVDQILKLLDQDQVLDKQKLDGIIDENQYAKEKEDVWKELNDANTQYKELSNTKFLPEDLQKRRDDLDPIIIDYASSAGTALGNQSDENKKEIRDVYKDVAEFLKNNCEDSDIGKVVLQDISDYKIYGTPAGKSVVIKGAENLNLESIYPNDSYPDLNVPKGALVAFTKGSISYKAKYKKESGKWRFVGYFNSSGNEYIDTDTESFRQKLESKGISMAEIPIVMATGASKEFSKSILKNIGLSEAALAGEGLLSLRSAGIAIIGYIIIETFTSPVIITPIEHGDVLDIPSPTPIAVESADDEGYVKIPPVEVPITIPHALPKEETANKGCQVYCIYKINKLTKEITVAKYGMTCQENFKSDGKQDCNPRPEYQTTYFNKTDLEFTFYYTWITPFEVSKSIAYIIERSMTANFIRNNEGRLPSHHKRPCFIQGDTFEKEQERTTKAVKWITDQILKYGK